MNINLKHILLLLFFSCSNFLLSQDVRFSQFYSSPLTLNPALTGSAPGDLRVVANYRNQNYNLIPYATYSGSFEMNVLRNKLKHDKMSAGAVILKDDLGNQALSSLFAYGSAAYHLAMGSNKDHFISLGFQGGIIQRQIDMNNFTFPNQWVFGEGYNESISHGLNVGTDQTMIIDMNGGLFWYHFIENNSSVFAGASVFHLLEPEETFLSNNDQLTRRIVLHGGRRIPVNESMAFIPNLLFMMQNKAQDVAGGTTFEYRLNNSYNAFKAGLWYRYYENSFISYMGFSFSDFEIGISYDFYSKVQSVSETRGGLEFSVIYSPVLKNIVNLDSNPGTSF